MNPSLRALIIEDSEDDTLLLAREIGRGDYDVTFKRVETAEGMREALAKKEWDIIISDYEMPHFSVPEALELLHKSGLDIPFIIVSGAIGEETAVDSLKAGAHDFIMKSNLSRFIPAIKRELQEAGIRQSKRQVEEQLKASLKEKEVLLQEIHHRVKNNMQIISSLFNLQSRLIKDNKMAEIFKSCQNRVRSMALIHEKLYKSEDFARVNLAEYVELLSTHLLRSYGINPDVIQINIDIKDIFLDINTAIPCSLIINELVSNSLKHAFPGDKKGKINITIHSLNKKEVELIVSDDGVGLPEDVDFRGKESLGLHMVNILANDQLHGSIKLDRNKGTSFRIQFRGRNRSGK